MIPDDTPTLSIAVWFVGISLFLFVPGYVASEIVWWLLQHDPTNPPGISFVLGWASGLLTMYGFYLFHRVDFLREAFIRADTYFQTIDYPRSENNE